MSYLYQAFTKPGHFEPVFNTIRVFERITGAVLCMEGRFLFVAKDLQVTEYEVVGKFNDYSFNRVCHIQMAYSANLSIGGSRITSISTRYDWSHFRRE